MLTTNFTIILSSFLYNQSITIEIMIKKIKKMIVPNDFCEKFHIKYSFNLQKLLASVVVY